MHSPTGSKDLEVLRQAWRQWTEAVERLARRRRVSRLDELVYPAVHRRTLLACQEMIERSNGSKRAQYEAWADLVQPWLNPVAFTTAEREILADLCERCRAVGRQLGCWTWVDRIWPYRHWLASLVGVLLVAGFLFVTAEWILLPIMERAEDFRRVVWINAREFAGAGFVVAGLLAGLFVVACIILMGSRH
jgi:hypothetical protein